MSIMKHVTLQKIVAHDFRYDPRGNMRLSSSKTVNAFVAVEVKFHEFILSVLNICKKPKISKITSAKTERY